MPQNIHKIFIRTGISLGYPLNWEGCCTGITLKWLEACLLHEEDVFNQRMAKIGCEDSSLVQNITQVKEKVKRHESLTSEEIDLLEILAFYENVELYQSVSAHEDLVNSRFVQKDLEPLSLLAGSEPIISQGGLIKIYSESGIYTKEEIVTYLDSLRQTLQQLGYQDKQSITIKLCSLNHSIGLAYSVESSSWQLMDINQWPPITATDNLTADIAEKIVRAFNECLGVTPRLPYTAFTTTILTVNENKKLIRLAPQLTTWKKSHVLTRVISEREATVTLAYLAAKDGDADLIAELATHGVNFNITKEEHGTTPAIIAAENGHVHVIAELAKHNVDLNIPNKKGVTPLLTAVACGQILAITALAKHGVNLEQGKDDGINPVQYACYIGYIDVLDELVKQGANLDVQNQEGKSIVHFAAQEGHALIIAKLVEYGMKVHLIQDAQGITPAMSAASNGHVNVIAELAKHQADFNIEDIEGNTATYYAALYGHAESITELAKYEAELDKKNKAGVSPFFIATQYAHLNVMDVLAKHGVNLNARTNQGATLAHIAAKTGDATVIAKLGELGANLNAALEGDIITPAYIAAYMGHLPVIMELSNHHVDLTISFSDKKTVLILAAGRGHMNIVSYLFSNVFSNTPLALQGLMSDTTLSDHIKMTCLVELETAGLLEPIIKKIEEQNYQSTFSGLFFSSKMIMESYSQATQEMGVGMSPQTRVLQKFKSMRQYAQSEPLKDDSSVSALSFGHFS